jgi:hypothetical protein
MARSKGNDNYEIVDFGGFSHKKYEERKYPTQTNQLLFQGMLWKELICQCLKSIICHKAIK